MTPKRVVALAVAACTAVPAATGIAGLEDDDYCSANEVSFDVYTETGEVDQEIHLVPPGLRCVYTQPDGSVATADATGWGEFIPVLAGELLIIGLVAWRSPQVPVALRLFAGAISAIGIAGLGGLVGGFVLAATVGFFFGVPIACVVSLLLARGAGAGVRLSELAATLLLSGLAVCSFLFWWLWGSASAAWWLALGPVALFAYLGGGLLARMPRRA